MLQGSKRPRPRMRRTTSMTELSSDDLRALSSTADDAASTRIVSQYQERRRVTGMAGPPRSIQRRSFSDFGAVQTTAPFLMICGHCRRALGAGLDTYIYRGEFAFCSLECRQYHVTQDELKKKSSLVSVKTEAGNAANAEGSSNGETTVAA